MRRSPTFEWRLVVLAAIGALILAGCARPRPNGGTPAPGVAGTQVSDQSAVATADVAVAASPTAMVAPVITAKLTSETEAAAAVATPTPRVTDQPSLDAPTATPRPTSAPGAGAAGGGTTPSSPNSYVVQPGDNLFQIALKFGTTVEAIKAANGLATNVIYPGQRLTIPAPGSAPPAQPGGVHIVQPGETLFQIATRYGTTVEALVAANGIVNPWFIYVGQKLIIPDGSTQPGPGARTHIVRPGETLNTIALAYGTTAQAIALANNLANPNLIFVGQPLIIP